jgi:hypothetical protein
MKIKHYVTVEEVIASLLQEINAEPRVARLPLHTVREICMAAKEHGKPDLFEHLRREAMCPGSWRSYLAGKRLRREQAKAAKAQAEAGPPPAEDLETDDREDPREVGYDR